jgi:hypothetical protein
MAFPPFFPGVAGSGANLMPGTGRAAIGGKRFLP